MTVEEYAALLRQLMQEELGAYDAVILRLRKDGWYSPQEVAAMRARRAELQRLWLDRIQFYAGR